LDSNRITHCLANLDFAHRSSQSFSIADKNARVGSGQVCCIRGKFAILFSASSEILENLRKIDRAPGVEISYGWPGHLRPLLGLLQGKGNLLCGKTGPLHEENPLPRFFIWAKFSHDEWSGFPGADHR
jgi:hypothetical protein